MSEGPFRPRGERAPEPAHPARGDGPSPPEAPPSGSGARRRAAPPPAAGAQTRWVIGVAVALVLGYITLNTLRSDAPGSRGVKAGTKLPPFAAPLVTSSLVGDANVLVKGSDEVPRACDVRGPDVLNSCQLADRGPSVLAFLVGSSGACVDEIDTLERLRRRFPGVQFAAVAIRGDRADLRRLVRRHRWRMPVGHDRDGAVANAYAIAVCPTITFARRGGEVVHTTLGSAGERELVRRVEELAR